MICYAGDVNAFLVQHGCLLKVIVAQINSITDFYLGDSILLIEKDGPEICSQYYGGIKYLLDNLRQNKDGKYYGGTNHIN